MNELKISHITDGRGDIFTISRGETTISLDPQEALLVLQFLYERVDEITRLVNTPSKSDVPGHDHESIETHLQELSEAERRQAEGEH